MVETASLRDVARIDRKSVTPEKIETGSKYVGLENIESGGRLINVGTVANGELASSKFVFTSEHVLYGKLRPYLAKIALPEFDGICSTDIVPVLPGSKLDRRFLVHFLRQPNKVRLANSLATGANLPRLSPTALGEMVVPLPPLVEQRRIAAVLDKVDELRTKRRQALAHLDSLSATYVHDLLSQEEWPRRAFGELCSRVTVGVVVKPASHYVSAGIPALRSLNVRAGGLDMANLVHFSETSHTGPLRKSQLRPGDVVTVRTGNAGTSAVVPSTIGPLNAIDLIISTPLPGLMTPEYAVAFLNSDAGRRMVLGESRGQIQQHFNVKSLQMASIPVPPIQVQQALGSRLARVDRVKRTQLSQLAQLNALFASLQHRAFKGQL